MRPAFVSLILCVATAAPAQVAQDGGFDAVDPLDVLSARVEGLVGGPTDAGTLPATLAAYKGQPLAVYRLRCPDCPELESGAFSTPSALAETGVPVVLLLNGKNSTRAAAQKLYAKAPRTLRIAWGKKLTGVGGYSREVWLYGADGQPRAALSTLSSSGWALQAAAERALAETNQPLPVRKPHASLGSPFPTSLVEGLINSGADAGTAGPATLDGYLGQPYVIFLACPGCGGAADLEALLPLIAEHKLPVVALLSFMRSTRDEAAELAKQLGPRPNLRLGWGSQLDWRQLHFQASTALLVDKHGIVRQSVEFSETFHASNAWILRAGLERLLREK